jgi:hypothetical protein
MVVSFQNVSEFGSERAVLSLGGIKPDVPTLRSDLAKVVNLS